MNYRLIHNARNRSRLASFAAPLLFAVALVLFHFFYPTALASIAARIALPFWRAEDRAADLLRNIALFFYSKQALIADRDRLARDLVGAHALLLDRELLRDENRALLLQLGRPRREARRVIGAILSTPPRSPYDTAVIDVGLGEGVAEGDLAFSGSAVLGVVSKAYNHTSVIEFFSTPGRKTPISITRGRMAIPAEATGEGGGAFIALLPKAVPMSVGDAVIMPGFNPGLFAVVDSIESAATDSFQHIRFKNPVSIHTVRFLEIARRTREE